MQIYATTAPKNGVNQRPEGKKRRADTEIKKRWSKLQPELQTNADAECFTELLEVPINDRDSRGPTGNTYTLADLQDQFETGGLSTSQLTILKGQAKSSGFYSSADGGFNIQQGDLPSRDGNIVVYVEFPSGEPADNEVDLKFEWPHTPYTEGKALVVVKNGSVRMTGSAIGDLQGSIYCPDGPVTIHGGGSGTFTGFVWGKGMVDIGNFPFNMTEEFLADPPFYAWTIVRETAWTEVDRDLS